MAGTKRSCLEKIILAPFVGIGLLICLAAFLAVLFSFMNPIYFAREATSVHAALQLLEKNSGFKSNKLFKDTKHIFSLWIGAVSARQCCKSQFLEPLFDTIQGFLCLFNQLTAWIVLTPMLWPVIISLVMSAGSYTLLILPFLQLRSMLPNSVADCGDPAKWPEVNGYNLFDIYGGNATFPRVPIAGCKSLKEAQYWATAVMYVA
jgi:hypothetical protein